MQNATGGGASVESGERNDSYRAIVSDLESLIEHVQASMKEPARTRSGVNQSVLIGVAPPLFPVLSLQEMDINFRSIDADKFASAIGQAGRR